MIFFLLLSASAVNLDQGYLSGYLSMKEAYEFMDTLSSTYPDFVDYFTLGQTSQIRDIRGIKLTNKSIKSSKSISVFSASQISGYPISTTSVLYIAESILKQATYPYISYLLSTREIYFFPMMNPDAYAWTEKNFDRTGKIVPFLCNRNFTGCSGLVDNGSRINRNWGYKWNSTGVSSWDPCSETYPGLSPFSEVETRVVKDMFDGKQVMTWMHYEWVGNKYVLPYTYQTATEYTLLQNYTLSRVTSTLLDSWEVGNSQNLTGTLEDGSLIDYYFNKGAVTMQASIGNETLNSSEIISTIDEHLDSAIAMVELGGVYLNFAGSKSWYVDCYPNCKNKDINYEAIFEFTVENKGMTDSSLGFVHFSVVSGLILETFLKINSVKVQFTRLYNSNDSFNESLVDSLHRSDSVYYIENFKFPALSSAKFTVETWANSTSDSHEKVNMLCEFSLTFTDGYDYGFTENEILKVKDHEDENDGDDDDDGNKAVVVGVVVSLVLLTVLIGAGVIGYKCWKKKNAELEKPDFNTTMQAENKL